MNLTRWREEEGLTQTQAAARFGVNQSVYSRWESGKRRPTVESAALIIDRTGGRVALSDLLAMPTASPARGDFRVVLYDGKGDLREREFQPTEREARESAARWTTNNRTWRAVIRNGEMDVAHYRKGREYTPRAAKAKRGAK